MNMDIETLTIKINIKQGNMVAEIVIIKQTEMI